MNILMVLPLLYLDPGSGSLIAQMLAAGVLGAGVLIKVYWNKIKGIFTKKPKDEAVLNESEHDEPDNS